VNGKKHAMSWQSAEEPEAVNSPSCKVLQRVIVPRPRDLGGFEVRRVLPSLQRSVGPFVFLDQMGSASLNPGQGIDVRPHPHIGLATVTYLFTGTIVHRDSLGSVQAIETGAVNWMTAGRGIVHSERSDQELRKQAQKLYGIQSWVALPAKYEETVPDFVHYPAEDLPELEGDGKTVRIIAGSMFGKTSPVKTHSPLFYCEVTARAAASVNLETGIKSARCISSRARSKSPSKHYHVYDCCCSAVSRSMDRVTSSGISSQARANASNRPRPTGSPGASPACLAMTNSFLFLKLRDLGRSISITKAGEFSAALRLTARKYID
jgi:redox-sensitive bicupin YhaK (pirin superfamily)